MQTIRFGKPKDSDVIDIDDVVEDDNKIYCYECNGELRFLVNKNGDYWWTALTHSCFRNGVSQTFKNALNECNLRIFTLMIFSSQREVLEYAKNM